MNDEKTRLQSIMYLLFECVEIPPRSLYIVDPQLVTIIMPSSHRQSRRRPAGIPRHFLHRLLRRPVTSKPTTWSLTVHRGGASHNQNGACLLIGHILDFVQFSAAVAAVAMPRRRH